VTAALICVIETVDDKPDCDFNGNSGRAHDGAGSGFCANLHHYRLARAKGLRTRLLREQIVLRDFHEKNCSGFPTVCKKLCGF
jgi:hypothetical protein